MIYKYLILSLIILVGLIYSIDAVNIGILFQTNQLKQQVVNSLAAYNKNLTDKKQRINPVDIGNVSQITTTKLCSFVEREKPIAFILGKIEVYNRDQIVRLLDNFGVPVFIFDNDIIPQNTKSTFYMNSFNIESLYDLIDKKRYDNITAFVNNENSLYRIEQLMKMISQRNVIGKNIQLKYISDTNDNLDVKSKKIFLIDIDDKKKANQLITRIIRNNYDTKIITINFDFNDFNVVLKNRSFTLIGWGGFKIMNKISFQSDFNSPIIIDDFLKFFVTQLGIIQKDKNNMNFLQNPTYKKCDSNFFDSKINKANSLFINALTDTKNSNNFIFDSNGQRKLSKLLIWFYDQNGLLDIKYWSDDNKFTFQPNRNLKKIRVVTIANKPFVETLKTGFLIDLLNKLKVQLGIEVDLHYVADGRYGAISNNKWNGMIGELLNNKADLILADLTITKRRSKVVEFTYPIVTNGISCVYKLLPAESRLRNNLFWKPFGNDLWCFYFIFSFVIGGILAVGLWLSPNDWRCDSKYHCDNNNGNKEWIWLKGWQYAFDALVRHPARSTPKSHGVKLLLVIWWCFTLVLTCLYISLLFVNIQKQSVETGFVRINSVSEMLKNSLLIPMVVNGGSTYSWLSKSNSYSLKRVFDQIQTVTNYDEGIRKVKSSTFGTSQYGMIMESSTADYLVNQNCNKLASFTLVPSHKSIALATRLNSPLNDQLNQALLRMKKSQELTELFRKWFRPNDQCFKESVTNLNSNFRAFDMSEIQMLFYLLLAMLFFSLCVWLLEHICLMRAHIFANVRSSAVSVDQNHEQVVDDTKKEDCFENEHIELNAA